MDAKYLIRIENELYKMLDDPKVNEFIRLMGEREKIFELIKKDAKVSYACGVYVTSPLPGLTIEVINRREYDFTKEYIEKLLERGHKAVKVNLTDLSEDDLKECESMLRVTKQSIKITDKTAFTEKYKRMIKEVKLR